MKQFEESLASTEGALKEARAEGKALTKQTLEVEQAIHAATEELQASQLYRAWQGLMRIRRYKSFRLHK